ncbi:MAG: hypothetical protein JNM27_13175 [Leptospirales bacterium]|nr:hypothetical protein [Leptospirales bacterium]
MHWEMGKAAADSLSLPVEPALIAYRLQDRGTIVPSAVEGPVCILTEDDLKHAGTWQKLLSTCKIHPVAFARYVNEHFPSIQDEVFCQAIGWKTDFQNLADFREMKTMDSLSVQMAESFELPVNALRLWQRLEQRTELIEMFRARNLKRNLVREIVQDLYDLEAETRKETIAELLRYSASWVARSGTFPGEDLRDLVRRRRFPQSEVIRNRIREIKKSMALPGHLLLEIPPDLENGMTEIRLQFRKIGDFERLLAVTNSAVFQSRLKEILDLL